MANIEIKVYENITPEIQNLLPKFIKQNFDSINWNDPETIAEMEEWYWKSAQIHLLAYIGNELVGVAHITKRLVNSKFGKINIACFGGLVVSKNYRNHGIAHELLNKRFGIAKDWNSDIAFLNTNIDKLGRLFNKFGFVPLKQGYSFVGKSGKIHKDHSGMIAPIKSKDIFEKILKDQDTLFIGESNL